MTLELELRDLHAPVESYGTLECRGCDFESNYEGAPPQWPCRTAELVYSAEEIADWTETFESWRKWGRERERRTRLASGWGLGDEMNRMTQVMVKRMLEPMPLFHKLAEAPKGTGGKTVTFQISRSMADVDPE